MEYKNKNLTMLIKSLFEKQDLQVAILHKLW